MNCSEIRRRLSDAESLDRPPLPLRPHLAACSSCRNWLIHLTELEARLPLIPVPSSNAAKNRLLEQLRQPVPSSAQHLRVVVPDLSWTPPKERGLRKLSVAFALAAAVVMLAIGLSLWPRHQSETKQISSTQSQKEQVKWFHELREQKLAKAQTPQEKVDVLAEFADGLLREVRHSNALPADNRLALLAEVYSTTVRDELVKYAGDVPADQRRTLPTFAGELGRTESEFERLAATAPEASAVYLHQIAAAAREGDRALRQLAQNAKA